MSKATRKLSVTSKDVMQEVGNLLESANWQELLPLYLEDMEKELVGWPVWFTVRQELSERVYRQGGELGDQILVVFKGLDLRRQVFLTQGIENALQRRVRAKKNGSF